MPQEENPTFLYDRVWGPSYFGQNRPTDTNLSQKPISEDVGSSLDTAAPFGQSLAADRLTPVTGS